MKSSHRTLHLLSSGPFSALNSQTASSLLLMKTSFLHCLVLCLSLLTVFSSLHADESATAIPFAELGAKATAADKGQAIGITATAEGAVLRTGFQKLSGTVTREGLRLDSTEAEGGSLRLKATAVGRGEASSSALPDHGEVIATDSLVTFTRPGVVEEYSVSADGVRQDFIVVQRPAGAGDMSVALSLSGATAEPAGEGAKLTLAGSGRELAYSRLRVTDARDQELPARLVVLSPTRLVVLVQDAGAVYPVRIDPTFSDADWVSLNPGVPGTTGSVNCAVVDGSGNLYIGGGFSFVGTVAANNIAKWNGSTWSALGNGIDGDVYALAVSGSDLYASGNFDTASGLTVNNIAKWNGGTWSALGGGMDSVVYALAVSGSDLYAGGNFDTAGSVPVKNIAKWDGTDWSGLNDGTRGQVFALLVAGAHLYVGGEFTDAGGGPANNIAKWDVLGAGGWSTLGDGVSGPVYALAAGGSGVYVGGQFYHAGGLPANSIAEWNGSTWSALGDGFYDRDVNALAVIGSDLYAGGNFSTAGGVPANSIAKWNGSTNTWSALGTGMNISSKVNALAVIGSNLYAGGDFTSAGGVPARNFAKWNGSDWSALGSGMNFPVSALAVSGSDLYVGGSFTTTPGGVPANRIAKWNGSTWSPLGDGVSSSVYAMAVSGSDLYAGGDFTTAGGVPANRIAKWNGSTWSPLGDGVSRSVYALAVSGSNLYAGGLFSTAGGVPANRIAKWNGSTWSALGSGMDGDVNALAVSGSDLYAGGGFTTAGGVTVNRIAKWNGSTSTWSALGAGVSGGVDALAVIGSDLYAGGSFSTAGGVTANNVAKWNGSTWSALGVGVSSSVNALAVSGSDLYAGGRFTAAGGVSANFIAKWNGSAWSPLGTGVNGLVSALAVSGSKLYLGGTFTLVGTTTVSPFIAQANLPSPPTVTSVSPAVASIGSSVTITGSGFTGATTVTIGGVTVTSFTVVDDTTITTTVPAGVNGLLNVVVTNAGGPGTGTGVLFVVDYVITTTGNAIVCTDVSGHGDLLHVSSGSIGATVMFAATGRTFSVNGGPSIPDNSGLISRAGATSITINAGAGDDDIDIGDLDFSFGTFALPMPSLTVNGGTGNDTVSFTGDVTFGNNTSLDVDLQNDDADPGQDHIMFVNAFVTSTDGSLAITLRASVHIIFESSSIDAGSEGLTAEANGGLPSNLGIYAQNTNFSSIGSIVMKGTSPLGNGILLKRSQVFAQSDFTLIGHGDNDFDASGVRIEGTHIDARGDISITGQLDVFAGESSSGVGIVDGARIKSDRDIDITGTGAPEGEIGNMGVWLLDGTVEAGRSLTVNGTGGQDSAVGFAWHGIYIQGGRMAGSSVAMTGIAGDYPDSHGIFVENGSGESIYSGGSILLHGSSANEGSYGVLIDAQGGSAVYGSNLVTVEADTASFINSFGGGGYALYSDYDVIVAPSSMGRKIVIGEADSLATHLGLDQSELALIYSDGSLVIGSDTTGVIDQTADIVLENIGVTYRSGDDILFTNSSLATNGRNFVARPGPGHSFYHSGTATDLDLSGGTAAFSSGALGFRVASGTVYDTLKVAGGVDLSGVGLNLEDDSAGAYTPSAAQIFILIDNDGTDAVIGTFAGLAQGAIVSVNGVDKLITYTGGDGNDVVLIPAAAPPTVTAVSPATGPATGNTSVTITGTGFTGVTAVKFGGTAATSFTFDSDTQITATTPAHAAGAVSVDVTTAGGTNAPNTLFSYASQPAPLSSPGGDVASGGGAPDASGADSGADFDVLKKGGFLAENGHLVFPGTLLVGSGSPPVTLSPNTFMGLWKHDGSSLKLLARSGNDAPQTGSPAAKWDVLPQTPAVNDSGEITFLASLVVSGTSSPATTVDNDTGLWSELGGTGLSLLVREGDVIPGFSPLQVGAFASGAYATAHTGATKGEAAFSVTMKNGSTDTAILRASINGASTAVGIVARQNTAMPGVAGESFGNLAGAYTDSMR
ncbi:MAG: IPT/TIG domain-containing protein, partial [Verrucomicrobiaceae bacterium]|nr:IPT/TIG domain-containing protein [Verrucomicrobiaceae bacterium]